MKSSLKSVLYIDDEQDILDVVKMCLETVGEVDTTVSTDGAHAVSIAKALMPDLIMLDVMMPDIDGPSILLELRKYPEFDHIPVVFVTAKVQPADLARYSELGSVGVVVKPFDPMDISRQVIDAWDRAHVA